MFIGVWRLPEMSLPAFLNTIFGTSKMNMYIEVADEVAVELGVVDKLYEVAYQWLCHL